MDMYKTITGELKGYIERDKAEIYPKFFKTGKGEYGHGDIFWGITVPNVRSIAKTYYKDISFDDIKKLVHDPIHEVRLVGYMILTYQFEKANLSDKECIVDFYLENLEGVNNWDIVDLSCYKILGEYLILKPEMKGTLYKFADSQDLWKQRISIVSTYAFIKRNMFEDTLKISKILLTNKHDLIHKAIGWMLREVGKRDMYTLRGFLNENIHSMPRTTLRYAIEKMDEEERNGFLEIS